MKNIKKENDFATYPKKLRKIRGRLTFAIISKSRKKIRKKVRIFKDY